MNEILLLILVLIAGVLLGIIFFGGLWWTTKQVMLSGKSAMWLVGSFLLRTSIVLIGFYLLSNNHWERLLACLSGFIVARFVVIWWEKNYAS